MCNCKYFKNISKAFSALTMPHGDYSPETLAYGAEFMTLYHYLCPRTHLSSAVR
jgi:hypothetical protein